MVVLGFGVLFGAMGHPAVIEVENRVCSLMLAVAGSLMLVIYVAEGDIDRWGQQSGRVDEYKVGVVGEAGQGDDAGVAGDCGS